MRGMLRTTVSTAIAGTCAPPPRSTAWRHGTCAVIKLVVGIRKLCVLVLVVQPVFILQTAAACIAVVQGKR